MGDMGFSGGFETMAAGKDGEEWTKTVSLSLPYLCLLLTLYVS